MGRGQTQPLHASPVPLWLIPEQAILGAVGRSLWPVVTLALAAFKVHVLAGLLDHRAGAVSLFAVWLAVSLLRIRLVSVALAGATLVGIGMSAHSLVRGAMFGAGALIVLFGCFLTISTGLHVRQRVTQTRPGRGGSYGA